MVIRQRGILQAPVMVWGKNGDRGGGGPGREEAAGALLSLAPPEVRVCVSADITVNTTASIQISADARLN